MRCLGINITFWLLDKDSWKSISALKLSRCLTSSNPRSFESIYLFFVAIETCLSIANGALHWVYRSLESGILERTTALDVQFLLWNVFDWTYWVRTYLKPLFLLCACLNLLLWLRMGGKSERRCQTNIPHPSAKPVSFLSLALRFMQVNYCTISAQSSVYLLSLSQKIEWLLVAIILRAQTLLQGLLLLVSFINIFIWIASLQNKSPGKETIFYEMSQPDRRDPGPDDDDAYSLPIPVTPRTSEAYIIPPVDTTATMNDFLAAFAPPNAQCGPFKLPESFMDTKITKRKDPLDFFSPSYMCDPLSMPLCITPSNWRDGSLYFLGSVDGSTTELDRFCHRFNLDYNRARHGVWITENIDTVVMTAYRDEDGEVFEKTYTDNTDDQRSNHEHPGPKSESKALEIVEDCGDSTEEQRALTRACQTAEFDSDYDADNESSSCEDFDLDPRRNTKVFRSDRQSEAPIAQEETYHHSDEAKAHIIQTEIIRFAFGAPSDTDKVDARVSDSEMDSCKTVVSPPVAARRPFAKIGRSWEQRRSRRDGQEGTREESPCSEKEDTNSETSFYRHRDVFRPRRNACDLTNIPTYSGSAMPALPNTNTAVSSSTSAKAALPRTSRSHPPTMPRRSSSSPVSPLSLEGLRALTKHSKTPMRTSYGPRSYEHFRSEIQAPQPEQIAELEGDSKFEKPAVIEQRPENAQNQHGEQEGEGRSSSESVLAVEQARESPRQQTLRGGSVRRLVALFEGVARGLSVAHRHKDRVARRMDEEMGW